MYLPAVNKSASYGAELINTGFDLKSNFVGIQIVNMANQNDPSNNKVQRNDACGDAMKVKSFSKGGNVKSGRIHFNLFANKEETSFSYDLERMDKMLNCDFLSVPKGIDNLDDFEDWLRRAIG